MKITKEFAQKLWRERYGLSNFATDFCGNYMCFEGYGDPDYYRFFNGEKIYCGWNIHHVLPKSKGGTDDKSNLVCTNIITNMMAADKITYWIDDEKYQVRKNNGGYRIQHMD